MKINENTIVYIVGAISPPSSKPMDYTDVDTITQPRLLNKPGRWNMEYNYGRRYEHSKGQEWGTGYNNQYNDVNVTKPKLSQTELSPVQWTSSNTDKFKIHAQGISERNDEQQASMLRSNDQKKQFQEKTGSEVKNWHNWPSKNITWPGWVLKGNHFKKQLVPWWNTGNQQVMKAQKVARFMSGEAITKQKPPFWPGSVGWTGDLGPFGEVPSPPWLSKDFTSN
ncbi:hypothetical protein LOAG_09355 [Loa loa]|uniref:Uncharacterized protein n=1 Tax=Loa loa TaxID=7209 RepID=A0A1I7VQ21_LOALO|nr:hypothetical protein LOAG_09355 [Loa loa]EFO19140.1 hypothetical protein LOAG_09355 [Loa loa]